MSNLLLVLIFIAGLVLLWFGARGLVSGSSDLALKLGIRPMVVGLTVVAFGTSAPELVVSIIAAIAGSPDVAIGNVVGSNIANICLIVGLTALILPIPSDRSFLKLDMPYLFAAMAVLFILCYDGIISRLNGILLLAGLAIFVYLAYKTSGSRGAADEVDETRKLSMTMAVLFTMAGLIAITIGARMMVYSAVEMARNMGISEVVIGATIVAIGTSLPELATSLVAIIKKQPGIGLGNVIGSNVFNICLILGAAPIIMPLAVSRRLLTVEFPIMVATAVVFFLMLAKRSNRITKPEGVILFAGYVVFLVWSFYSG